MKQVCRCQPVSNDAEGEKKRGRESHLHTKKNNKKHVKKEKGEIGKREEHIALERNTVTHIKNEKEGTRGISLQGKTQTHPLFLMQLRCSCFFFSPSPKKHETCHDEGNE